MKLHLVDVNDYERNVHYHPEVHGLTKVDEVDYSSGSYEFDIRAVWRDAEGRLWTARDSGCSCPTPFEHTTDLDRLLNVSELEKEYEDEKYSKPDGVEFRAFIEKVRAAFGVTA